MKYSPVGKEALLYYRKDESMMAELIPSTFSFIWIWGEGIVLQVIITVLEFAYRIIIV